MPKPRSSPLSRRRPHNKSWLWDHYVEHYDSSHRDSIMANSKHKGAFCRSCLERAINEVSRSSSHQLEFESTNIAQSWDEWKYQKAFEQVPKISGRRPNLWKHIDTCGNISAAVKNPLRARFIREEAEIQRLKEHKAPRTPPQHREASESDSQSEFDTISYRSLSFGSPAPQQHARSSSSLSNLLHPPTPPTPNRVLVVEQPTEVDMLSKLDAAIEELRAVRERYAMGRAGDWEVREMLEKVAAGGEREERLRMACLVKENEVIRAQLKTLRLKMEDEEEGNRMDVDSAPSTRSWAAVNGAS